MPPTSPSFYQPIESYVKKKKKKNLLSVHNMSGSEKAIQVCRHQHLVLLWPSPVSHSLAIPETYRSPEVCALSASSMKMSWIS